MLFIVLFLGFLFCNSPGQGLSAGGCEPKKLTVYKVIVQTNWDRDVFPKQYPEWRPPAQWSKVIGRSHDSSYDLFHLGKTASDGLKQFAETGTTEVLEAESQGIGGIFDEFNAPPIQQGVGEAEAEFFVDGNHSMVSLAARVIPSPDWFIGIDSFDLCVEGKWIESVMLEVDPLDAGTDNGFTFTSPNWPTVPQNTIMRIKSDKPSHPANSFYYPDRMSHPPIATFHIAKVKEYELSRVFTPATPSKTKTIYPANRDFYSTFNPKNNEISNQISNKISKSLDRGYDVSKNEVIQHSNSIPMSVGFLAGESSKSFKSSKSLPESSVPSKTSTRHKLMQSLVKKYRKKYRKNRKGRKLATRRARKPRDCRVGDFGVWSSCSKTCGIGEQIRTREVLKHSRRGGRPCPLLEERKWCGSSRDCEHKYFDW